ncbi:MAG: hypothetical protein CMH48_07590 [Muricauda sp.]|nr:hypothetical protein [Allomuricauda sp.]MBC30694.1 hypothetical protein [Allomuricauda sp.]|tara:strand:- start:235 stop:981 length:747 start_codon:yes stop_codon:yes gene_type:complete
MKLSLSPQILLKYLIFSILLLLIGNIISIVIDFSSNNSYLRVLGSFFNFDEETSIPTFYSTLLLFICGLLLLYVYKVLPSLQSHRGHWLFLSIIFDYLALDEFLSLHERLIPITKDYFEFTGPLYYSWVLPYGLILAALTIYFLPFLKNLPKKITRLFILSGSTFVGGAIGMELFGGMQHSSYGKETFLYAVFYTIEETLEMLGLAIFIFALLYFIANHTQKQKIQISLEKEGSEVIEKTYKHNLLSD